MAEALRLIQATPNDAEPFRVTLVCGFTPLHLQTFLNAHLQSALPNRRVVLTTGLYGDLAGTLAKVADQTADGLAVVLEWEDLDPRLGFRSSGQWGPDVADEILSSVTASLQRVTGLLTALPRGMRVAVAGPTLPLPPLFHTPAWRVSVTELAIQEAVAHFRTNLATDLRFAVVSPQCMAEQSSAAARYDLESDLEAGLPYGRAHADTLGRLLASNLVPAPAKKGIITDLDDTLWAGILGEVGPEAVSWDLGSHTHLHGLYQKLIAALSREGILVAIASKNDPSLVERALKRRDLLLSSDLVFPIEVHWNAKSGSVTRILQTWNIAADSVVFVDDSPMELAEVAAVHPGIETVQFPRDDVSQGLAMLRRLRDLCGKERLSQEDSIRLDSIRRAAAFREGAASGEAASESFLQELNSVVTLDFHACDSPRVFELVNKTNQFNLNGTRYTEAEWRQLVSSGNSILLAVAYEDRFGPLGTIAVLQATVQGSRALVNSWVLSCRAFARRIEHVMLQALFDQAGVEEVEFSFVPTPRNGPLQDFLRAILGKEPEDKPILTREQFTRNCPPLYHRIQELKGAEASA
jgi:FkbH-like protein